MKAEELRNNEEVWKKIPDFKCYFISNKGRVRTGKKKVPYNHAVTGNRHYRVTEDRFLKIYENNRTGYKFVQLRNNYGQVKNKTIHRLVAQAFCNNTGFSFVNHKDGNKHNNASDNLEWCSNEYNHKHATESGLKAKGSQVGGSILNESSVHAIKYFLLDKFSRSDIAEAFLVSRSTISLIAEGKTWKHV